MNDDRDLDDDGTPLDDGDRRVVELLRERLDPGERTAVERAAFRARLEERLGARRRTPWSPIWMAAGTALVALALWWAPPSVRIDGGGTGGDASVEEGSGWLAYAYYETDYLARLDSDDDFLSEEYRAIATAFDVD